MPTGQSTDRLVTKTLIDSTGSSESLAVQTLKTLQFIGGGRRAMGVLTFSGQPSDAQIVTIEDGVNDAVVFEFDDDSSIVAGRVSVTIGTDAEATLDNLLAAINAQGDPTLATGFDSFQINGTKEGATIINLKNIKVGSAGNITITENADNFAVTGMILGADVGQVDTEMQAEVIVSTGDIEIGSVNLLSSADDQIDPSAAYADDTAHTAADWLTPAGAVRTDSRGTLVDTTADYSPLQVTANGDLRVRDDDLMTEVETWSHIEDTVHTTADVGLMPLAVRTDSRTALSDTTGDYTPLQLTATGDLRTRDDDLLTEVGGIGDAATPVGSVHAQLRTIAEGVGGVSSLITDCDDHTAFAAISDATNIANATEHVTGTSATNWDKAGTNVNSGVDDTIVSVDMSSYGPSDHILFCLNVSSTVNIATAVLRLGTDNSNYTEWQWDDDQLVTGWQILTKKLSAYTSITGTGLQQAAITYVSFHLIFDLAANTLDDITLDHVGFISAESIASEDDDIHEEDVLHISGDKGSMPLAVRTDTRASLSSVTGDYTPLQTTSVGELRTRDDDVNTKVDALSHIEDTAHTTADVGIQTLAVRNDTLATLADTDGDYAPLQVDADGALYIKDEDVLAELQSVSYVEDTAHTTADPGLQILAVRNDALATLCDTDGDYVPLQVDADGALYTKDEDVLTELQSTSYVEDTAHTTADPGTQILAVRNDALATLCDTDGDYVPLQVDADGALYAIDEGVNADMDTLITIVHIEDTAHTTADPGIQTLAVRTDARGTLADTTGDYAPLQLTANGDLRTRDDDALTRLGTNGDASDPDGTQAGQLLSIHDDLNRVHITIDDINATADWAASTDASDLTLEGDHVPAHDVTNSLSFDKDGVTVVDAFYGKTISAANASELSDDGVVNFAVRHTNYTNVAYIFIRLGSDAGNYHEFRFDPVDFSTTLWEHLAIPFHDGLQTGTGLDLSDITYVAFGVTMDAAANTILNVFFNHLHAHSVNLAELSVSSESTANTVRVSKMGSPSNAVVQTDAGAMGTGVQRITLATDDSQFGSIGAASDVDGDIHGQLRYIGEHIGSAENVVQACNDATDFAAVLDAQNIADITNHATGSVAVEWDKTGGSNVESGIDDTITSLNLSNFSVSDYIMVNSYIPDLSDVAKVSLRIGTSNAHYMQYDWDDSELVAATWQRLYRKLDKFDAIVGNGWDLGAVTWVSWIVTFDGAANLLNAMIVDRISLLTAETISLIDDAVHADDDLYAAFDKGILPLVVRNDNLGTTYTTVDQSYGPMATTEKGALHVAVGDGVATAQVVTDAALTTDIDGGNALHVAASLYARQDDDTVEPVVANASGQLVVEVASTARAESNPVVLELFVAVPGTREAFAATQQVSYFTIRAGKAGGANTGNVYIGTTAVDNTTAQQIILSPGDVHTIQMPDGKTTDLDAWFVDADNAADGITGFYIA